MAILSPFVSEILGQVVTADAAPDLTDNVDPTYEAPELPPDRAARRLAGILRLAPEFEALSGALANPDDRELLIRVLVFRVLGRSKVRHELTRERVLELVETANTARVATATGDLGMPDWPADDYDLSRLGVPLELSVHLTGIVGTFLLEQYRYAGPPDVGAEPGDRVIDGGGCWGDTALYFANLVGPEGQVLTFEPDAENLRLLQHNRSRNPVAGARIEVREAALWDRSGERLSIESAGPGTRVGPDGRGATVVSETVDALLERGDLDRVDFIKLDIEGTELKALQGAERTLRRFRPRLAIAAYHAPNDLVELSGFLTELGVGYRFALKHNSMDQYETVLFAHSPDSA